MKEFTYVIRDPLGLHARPAGLLAKEAARWGGRVTVAKGETSVDTRRIMALMGLCVKQGDEITLCVEGGDEEAAEAALVALLNGGGF